MADCEMCGKRNVSLVKAQIEGTTMTVCTNCARYGKQLASETSSKTTNYSTTTRRTFVRQEKPEQIVVTNAKDLIQQARRDKGLDHKKFALSINEKESVIAKIESGHMTLSIPLAKKIEKALRIKLIEDDVRRDVELPQHGEAKELTMEQLILKAMEKKKKKS